MKHAILSLLVITSTVASIAVAQDGSGHGPPHSPIIIGPSPTSVPTTTSPTTTSPTRQIPPKLALAPTMK